MRALVTQIKENLPWSRASVDCVAMIPRLLSGSKKVLFANSEEDFSCYGKLLRLAPKTSLSFNKCCEILYNLGSVESFTLFQERRYGSDLFKGFRLDCWMSFLLSIKCYFCPLLPQWDSFIRLRPLVDIYLFSVFSLLTEPAYHEARPKTWYKWKPCLEEASYSLMRACSLDVDEVLKK